MWARASERDELVNVYYTLCVLLCNMMLGGGLSCAYICKFKWTSILTPIPFIFVSVITFFLFHAIYSLKIRVKWWSKLDAHYTTFANKHKNKHRQTHINALTRIIYTSETTPNWKEKSSTKVVLCENLLHLMFGRMWVVHKRFLFKQWMKKRKEMKKL